jgi:hypothetical protein
MQRVRRHFPLVVAALLLGCSVASVLASANATARAQGAAQQASPTFQVTACSTDPGEAAKYDSFLRGFRKFEADLRDNLLVADEVQSLLGEAYMWSNKNTARMIESANEALASLSNYRANLDQLALDLDAMKRSADLTDNRGVASLIESALAQMDGGVSSLYQSADQWGAAANAFLAYNYDGATSYMEGGATLHYTGILAIQAGDGLVTSALTALYESSACEKATDVVSPMSATQVSRSAGGGGTQRGGKGDLSVVAPKRLKLKKRGATKLPMTLKASRPGLIEIWLKRGQKLTLNTHGTAFKEGKTGLRLDVPHAAAKTAKRKLQLKITFTPSGAVDATQTINLTIRPV